jgi:predicted NAD/FAD-dependent oxidoreductase
MISPSVPKGEAALDEELTRLHADTDHAARLTVLHEAAADLFSDDPGARRFQLTHAWVFALVDGDEARVATLEQQLRALGGL